MFPSIAARCLVVAIGAALCAQETPAGVEIARFSGNRAAAVSYTFDDGTLGHYQVAAPTFERYGFRATFAVNPGKIADDPAAATAKAVRDAKTPNPVRRVSWQEWRDIAARGHEVANHGLLHRGLTDLDAATLDQEVNEAARIITAKVGVAPLSFVYPGNKRNPAVRDVVLKTHIATREREQRFGGPGFNAGVANGIVDKAIAERSAVIVMAHAVAEEGYQPTSAEDLDAHLRYVATVRDRIWVDTMGNVARYARERDAATLAVTDRQAEAMSFELGCPLDAATFAAPLTCVVHPGAAVAAGSLRCQRGDTPIPATVSGDAILVEVVPGPGAVTVRWQRVP